MNSTTLYFLASVFFTSGLSAIFGMAGGLLLKGALISLYTVSASMVIHGIIQGFANLTRAWMYRKEAASVEEKRGIYVIILVHLLVAIAFVLTPWRPNPKTVYIVMGVLPYFALAVKRLIKIDIQNVFQATVLGILIQGAQLSSGVSGPVLDLAFLEIKASPKAIIGLKSLVMICGHFLKICVYWKDFIHSPNLSSIGFDLSFGIVISLLGTQAGSMILDRISENTFRSGTRWIVRAIGLFYLYWGIFVIQ